MEKTCNCYGGNFMMQCDICNNNGIEPFYTEAGSHCKPRVVGDCMLCDRMCIRCIYCNVVLCEFCWVPDIMHPVCHLCFLTDLKAYD